MVLICFGLRGGLLEAKAEARAPEGGHVLAHEPEFTLEADEDGGVLAQRDVDPAAHGHADQHRSTFRAVWVDPGERPDSNVLTHWPVPSDLDSETENREQLPAQVLARVGVEDRLGHAEAHQTGEVERRHDPARERHFSAAVSGDGVVVASGKADEELTAVGQQVGVALSSLAQDVPVALAIVDRDLLGPGLSLLDQPGRELGLRVGGEHGDDCDHVLRGGQRHDVLGSKAEDRAGEVAVAVANLHQVLAGEHLDESLFDVQAVEEESSLLFGASHPSDHEGTFLVQELLLGEDVDRLGLSGVALAVGLVRLHGERSRERELRLALILAEVLRNALKEVHLPKDLALRRLAQTLQREASTSQVALRLGVVQVDADLRLRSRDRSDDDVLPGHVGVHAGLLGNATEHPDTVELPLVGQGVVDRGLALGPSAQLFGCFVGRVWGDDQVLVHGLRLGRGGRDAREQGGQERGGDQDRDESSVNGHVSSPQGLVTQVLVVCSRCVSC